MKGRNCCVSNCRRRSHDHRGRKILNGLTFHCIPAWRTTEGGQISGLTRRRRAAWLAAVDRSDVTFDHIPASMRVCSRHFHSGKPAYEMLETDPDWVPSLYLGLTDGNIRRTERVPPTTTYERQHKHRKTTDTRPSDPQTESESEADQDGDGETPQAPPAGAPCWTAVKHRLQAVLQNVNARKQPGYETLENTPAGHETLENTPVGLETLENTPAGQETLENTHVGHEIDLDFRDFFREALEASLDASRRSRTLSIRSPHQAELGLNVLKDDPCKRSSSCLNCVRLQRRIEELQEKLSRLTGEEEDTKSGLVFSDLTKPKRVLKSPEPGCMDAEETGWLPPLSPGDVSLDDGDEDADSGPEQTSCSSSVCQVDSSMRKLGSRRTAPLFRKAWLKMFWFLRYSPAQNVMWCHVCRLHADKTHQNLALIRGSNTFKIHGIKMHSSTIYHKDNLRRFMLHKSGAVCDVSD